MAAIVAQLQQGSDALVIQCPPCWTGQIAGPPSHREEDVATKFARRHANPFRGSSTLRLFDFCSEICLALGQQHNNTVPLFFWQGNSMHQSEEVREFAAMAARFFA